ncbi:hypothetical protein T4B_1605 [Trichinella pseudospiralis]|uniref:Uncharacterized protein n=1 Tax=Trichinella pseudospiralis TaxID=6337 RepID=A0A0V0YFJ8_TRIPS|nr:hypothetical protein T4E_4319 [Trichinella pseudospiralis]KRZ06429.1 hypothetical protein T4B_10802 [Trichinella pseudospiralis]KRZ06435.1 hypothetical protein T4B_14070 [Trichinella pseudospiralis]KRZ25035.1 hypothetical protein T4B_1605 [Trichinella pseudospiralis]
MLFFEVQKYKTVQNRIVTENLKFKYKKSQVSYDVVSFLSTGKAAGVISRFLRLCDGLGWTQGGTGAVPARAILLGLIFNWHCSSQRCKGNPTGEVFRRSRHFPRDALALMELRFF